MRRTTGSIEKASLDKRSAPARQRKKLRRFELRDLDGLHPAIRLRIERSVLEVFSEQEFGQVSLVELATRARTSLQTIYKYYGSKEALVFATLDRELGELAASLTDELRGIASYKERFRKMYGFVLAYFEGRPSVAALIQTSIFGNTWTHAVPFCQPDLMSAFTRMLAEGREQGVLTDEVEPRVLLDFLLGVLWRLVHMWLMRGMTNSLTQEADASFEVLWRALAKPQ